MYQGQDLDIATSPIELEAVTASPKPIGGAWHHHLLIETLPLYHYHYHTITVRANF
jgi:hypothetical protein